MAGGCRLPRQSRLWFRAVKLAQSLGNEVNAGNRMGLRAIQGAAIDTPTRKDAYAGHWAEGVFGHAFADQEKHNSGLAQATARPATSSETTRIEQGSYMLNIRREVASILRLRYRSSAARCWPARLTPSRQPALPRRKRNSRK